MTEEPQGRWETRVRLTAEALPYPPTPDLAPAVSLRLARPPAARRRFAAWALALVVLVLAALLAVPAVRAGLVEFLRIGAITVRLITPTPSATAAAPRASDTPPAPPAVDPLLSLRGRTTLDDARRQVQFSLRLPAYPPDLGAPDAVYVQTLGGAAPSAILVWRASGQPGRVRLALYELSEDVTGMKTPPEVVQHTTVNGAGALWVNGPHFLEFYDASGNVDYQQRRLVEGNSLLWVERGITYRLESGLSLDEAMKIAESLH